MEFELLMEQDAITNVLRNKWQPLANHVTVPPVNLFADVAKTELAEIIELWQDAFERSYYDSVLKGILLAAPLNPPVRGTLASENLKTTTELKDTKAPPLEGFGEASLQAILCIDEREDSICQHIEAVDKKAEPFCCSRFFSIEFYFQQEDVKFIVYVISKQ